MMPSQARKHRGMRTQLVAANWYAANGFPHAESTGAGRSGVDILGMVGCAVEVKARRDFAPLAWLKQAASNADGLAAWVVFRCDGQGEATVGQWGVLMTLEDHTRLLRQAGYGDALGDES